MKLLSLGMENFMPYKGRSVVEFPQDPVRNVMIIFGDNMRGKTSFLNALRWAFYGKAFGRHLREIPLHEILNNEAALEGDFTIEASVQFEADDRRYDLRRRAVKRSMVAVPSRPEDFTVVVALQRDGVALPGHLIEAEINRFAPEQVSRFFLFDGELLQEYETLLIEGSDQGKRIKEAIEQVLGVPTLIHGRDEAATLLKQFQRQQSRDLAHVEGLERQAEKQSTLQVRQESLENDLRSLKDRLARTRSERTVLDDDLEQVDSIHRAKTRLDMLETRQREISDRLKDTGTERLALLRDAWRDLLQPKLVARKAALFDEQSGLTREMEKRGRLESKANALRRILENSICPTCGRPTEESQRAETGAELGRIEADIRACSIDHSSLADVSARIREIDRLTRPGVGTKIRALDSEALRLGVDLTTVENEVERLVEEIHGYDTADIARKRAQRDGLLREEGLLGGDIGDRQRKLDDNRRELTVIARTLQNLPQARASRSTAMVKACMSVERVFSDSIERLRDDLRRHVERRATESFLKLTTQHAYKKLEINDNYGLTILDETGSRVTVRSAGAEQIVALSLIDGLARTGRAAGPVVMDTPFGRLDLRHRHNILRYLPTTTGQLVLLVHDGEIRRETDLAPVAERVGAEYEIREISARHSRIEKVTS
ncbi:AAA family ATPase [Accumulibacter sp.]|uniref:AAA family ATPase n=1 Tax=Accumulibacter sp. TaxID=2053492 RepID=UPI00262B1FF4|nr:AAA family ATPase [Accumulibacter sp.]